MAVDVKVERLASLLHAETLNGVNDSSTSNKQVASHSNKRDVLAQKIEFVKLVQQHKNVLFGDFLGEVTTRMKEDAWKAIHEELVSRGYDFFVNKPWTKIRDSDWQYVRRHALSRRENGTSATGQLGKLDALVLELIDEQPSATIGWLGGARRSNQANTICNNNSNGTSSIEQQLKLFASQVKQEPTVSPRITTRSPSSRIESPPLVATGNTSCARLKMPCGDSGKDEGPALKRRWRSECESIAEDHEDFSREELEKKKLRLEIDVLKRTERRAEELHALEIQQQQLKIRLLLAELSAKGIDGLLE